MRKSIKFLFAFMVCLSLAFVSGCEFGSETKDEPKEQEVKEYTVYARNDTFKVKEGEKIQLPNVTDEFFIGWVLEGTDTSKEGYELFDFNQPITSDVHLVAVYKKTVLVSFIYNSKTESVRIERGKTLEPTITPEKENYEFLGWTIIDGAKSLFDFNTPINNDLTLFPVFKIKQFKVTFSSDTTTEQVVDINTKVKKPTDPTKEGYTFDCWKLDGEEFSFDSLITEDITLVASFIQNVCEVSFDVDGVVTKQNVGYGEKAIAISNPKKLGYDFDGWYIDNEKFDFNTSVISNITLTAKFTKLASNVIDVEYDFGYECYQSKEDLRVAYYTDFYNFLLTTNCNLDSYDIDNVEDFLVAVDTWKFNGRGEMGGIGDAFGRYYLKKDVGGKLENQPESVFIGWCYKNNKYIDFIHHLETFFAYWRTDEGYSQSDPNGNDFYASPWASMVDTAKFFHFTSSNLQNTYAWFDSERVHYALDHIPGVGYVTLINRSTTAITLPTDVTRNGYEFVGWFDNKGNSVTVISSSMAVYARWTEGERLSLLFEDFIEDFNSVLGKSYDEPSKLDTSKLESDYMVTFGQNSAMTTKWMWLYKALADANNDTTKYPDASGFSWSTNKGFFLANLCGFFTRTQHEDTYLHNVSADFTNSTLVNEVLDKKPND